MKKKTIIISTIATIVVFASIFGIVKTSHVRAKTETDTVVKDIVSINEDGKIIDAITGEELSDEEVEDMKEKGIIKETDDGKIEVDEDKNTQTVTVTTNAKGEVVDAKTEDGKDVTNTAKQKQEEYTTESSTEKTTEAKKTDNNKAETTTENNNTTETKNTTTEQPIDKLPDLTFEPVEHTHSWDSGKVTTEPTCEKDGVKTYTCSCGETKTETIKAKGHNYNCETTEPTCDKDGKKVYTCKNCGKSYSETISAKGHSWGAEWTEEEVIGNAIEQTHYFGYNGVDLSLTYNIWSGADYDAYIYEHGSDFSGGGYGTRLVLYFPNGQYVITTTYRKCSVCNKTEVVKTEKVEIHAPGYY